ARTKPVTEERVCERIHEQYWRFRFPASRQSPLECGYENQKLNHQSNRLVNLPNSAFFCVRAIHRSEPAGKRRATVGVDANFRSAHRSSNGRSRLQKTRAICIRGVGLRLL